MLERRAKRRGRKEVRKERRKDEESLYFIIERDLDRGALFPETDGWHDQVSLGKGSKVDYIVRYGNKIIGIEIKGSFPKPDDFEQAERYLKYLDAIFLAYPSDWAAEASFNDTKKVHKNVGIISIALYRSHVIRRAVAKSPEKSWYQKGDYIKDHNDYFKWINKQSKKSLEKNDRLIGTVLHDGGVWVSINKDGKQYNDSDEYEVSPIKLTPKDWKTVAALYALHKGKSVFRSFTWDELDKVMNDKLNWGYPDTAGISLGLLMDYYSYGTCEYLYSLPNEIFIFEQKFRGILKEELGVKDFKRLRRVINELRHEHKNNQKDKQKEFLEERRRR